MFCTDPWVLSSIMHGYVIDFVSPPIQNSLPTGCVMSDEMRSVCQAEVESLSAKGVIRKVSSVISDGFVSNIFVIPKKAGGWQLIINLKQLNSFIPYQHFKMEGLDCVKFVLKKGDWLVKINLRDAYFLVPLSPECYKFFRFFYDFMYAYLCLSLGLCSAPHVFTKLLKPIVSFFRECGIRFVIYLDDILNFN